jgi:KDO2-lipid IV(A) lauroyltransferase
MTDLLYYIVFALLYPMTLAPFWLLYFFSDCLYFLVYHVFRYRRKIVRKNLVNSFPEKSESEILQIEKTFYRYFCDYFFETVKMLNMSDSRMKKHFIFKNIDLLQYFIDEGKSVVLLLGHCGNWEWVTSIALWLDLGESTVLGQVYLPQRDAVSNRLFLKLRSRFHTKGFSKFRIYRDIIEMRRENKRFVLGFMSDQRPMRSMAHIWMPFMNQDAPVITGTEKIIRQTGAVVCYLDITKTKRSYYEGKIRLITENPAENPENEITEKYIKCLEKTILQNPPCYLWTHNRWKYKKPNNE